MQSLFKYCFIFFFCLNQSHAQGVKGILKNKQGELLSYVSVYVQGTQLGTHTATDGTFSLALNNGSYQLAIKSVDYQTLLIPIKIENDWVRIEPILSEQVYTFKELKVSSKSENLAHTIMRKAIGAAPYYNRQVLSYQAKVYVKGTGKVDDSPRILKPAIKSFGVEVGKSYLTESVNELQFLQPATYKEKVLSISSTMPNNGAPKPMRMIRGSWYSNKNEEIVSPLSPQAFSVYNFTLSGSFYENGVEINKIKVEPKRKGNDVFTGDIYIIDKLWCIHSLWLTREEQGVKVITKTRFQAVPNYPFVWLPISYDFTAQGDYLGVKGSYRYFVSIKDYQIKLNPNIDHSWVKMASPTPYLPAEPMRKTEANNAKQSTKNQEKIATLLKKETLNKREMLQLAARMKKESERQDAVQNSINDSTEIIIDSLAYSRDSSFWQQERSTPLLDHEIRSMAEKMSKQKGYDTSKRNVSTYSISNLLWSGDSILFKNKSYFKHSGLFAFPYLNTVEGFGVQFLVRTGNTKPNNWVLQSHFKIPFERVMPQMEIHFSFRYWPQKLGWIELSGASNIRDFNALGIHPLVDGIQILAFQNNYSKWFAQEHIGISIKQEVSNGFQVQLGAAYYNRFLLENLNRFDSKNFSSNSPNTFINLGNYQSFQWSFDAIYRIKQGFKMRYNRKIYTENQWPILSASFLEGRDKQLQFRKLSFHVKQQVFIRHWLLLRYQLSQGIFLNTQEIYFNDFHHFEANQSWFYADASGLRFKQVPFYAFSTPKNYTSFQSNVAFKKLILKQIPAFALFNFKESLHVNALNTQEKGNYLEFGYGITELFRKLSLGSNAVFINKRYMGSGFWISWTL
jgi:hypothetical protein